MIQPFRSYLAGRRCVPLLVSALACALPLSTAAQTPPPPAAHGQVQQMTAFEVTGSRIKRLDNERPNPVLVISREEIEKTGITDVQQFIRKLPQNSLSYTNEAVFGFTPGAAGANLRGQRHGQHRLAEAQRAVQPRSQLEPLVRLFAHRRA